MVICLFFFFFNDTATTEIYTLSLHDALPISFRVVLDRAASTIQFQYPNIGTNGLDTDRKSTRLNSSHSQISYAVFCLKKKKIVRRSTPIMSKRERKDSIMVKNMGMRHSMSVC